MVVGFLALPTRSLASLVRRGRGGLHLENVENANTTGTVILGLPGEENIADYHGTHRELEPGDSATLTHDTDNDTLTIETKQETETLPASDNTQINLFQYDYILFEYYKNAQPTKQHINYGDI